MTAIMGIDVDNMKHMSNIDIHILTYEYVTQAAIYCIGGLFFHTAVFSYLCNAI